MFRYLLACLAMMVFISMSSSVKACDTITDKDRIKLEAYINTLYKLPEKQTVALVDGSVVDAACYRKLVFRASVPAPLLTLYLTPDGKHLVSNVMDLTIDPIVAQHKKQREFEELLASGALLTSPPSGAPARIVVFSDFQCPYCKRFAEIVSGLNSDERVKLQITYRQLPLNIHAWARDASELSACVALQDKAAFWKLHDFLFAQQGELSKETVVGKALGFLAQEKTVDRAKVESCLAEKTYEDFVRRDEQVAMDLGITGTPTVFINGRKVSVRSVEDLRAAIRSAEAEDGPPVVAQRQK